MDFRDQDTAISQYRRQTYRMPQSSRSRVVQLYPPLTVFINVQPAVNARPIANSFNTVRVTDYFDIANKRAIR